MPTAFEDKGLGGAIKVMVTCHGCGNKIHYASSMVCLKETRRNCVSLALGLCFLIWGHGYPIYHKVLRLGLGMQTLAYKNFFNIIRIAHPVVKSILDEICEMGKSEMKAKDPTELGSWQRAVTTSDGCWLIRGHHSQCCTFVVINFLTGCTLYYGHACMRGSNNICDSELWEGTAKAAEGHLAEVCFSKAKEEGMVVAINWQDADSSSAKSFRYVFPDSSLSRVMLCGGHVGRSHANNLKDYKSKKSVDQSFISMYAKDYPQLASAKCECAGKRAHSKKCGCMSDEFLGRAKSNHFSALKQSGNDPKEYANRMRILGKYHSRNIHKWTGDDGRVQTCPWHPQFVCSCGKCNEGGSGASGSGTSGSGASSSGASGSGASGSGASGSGASGSGASGSGASGSGVSSSSQFRFGEAGEDSGSEDSEDSEDSDGELATNYSCVGKPYQVRGKVLTCDLHSLLYEIECNRIAEKANEVIDPVMGKGHSNLPESKFHVLTKFRPKDKNLHQLHYEFSTNLGLCQGNMTYLIKRKGPTYHWMRDLFFRMGLPEVDGIDEIMRKENQERMKRLERQKTDRVKKQRVTFKQVRQQEQKKR